jgi:hypothetical protein
MADPSEAQSAKAGRPAAARRCSPEGLRYGVLVMHIRKCG